MRTSVHSLLQRGLWLALALALPRVGLGSDYVVHVSCDGLRGDVLARMLAADTSSTFPGFARFVAEGATTFNARTDYTHTITLPNHTSMLTGRPVLQPAGQPVTVHHGYTSNVDPLPGVTLHNGGNPNLTYVASAFDVVHDAGLSTALYASKTKFSLYDVSYDAAHGAADLVPPDHGRDKIDRARVVEAVSSAADLHATLLAEMAADPVHYCFVHYLDLDAIGHAFGWDSPTWQATVRNVDSYLADLLAMVAGHPLLAGKTTVLVTADHGGVGTNHGNAALAANYTIPFLAWGAGVAPGADLYALNAATRTDPGTGRPDYNAPGQPIRNGESGNLALALLGLPPVPGSTIGSATVLLLQPPTAVRSGTWSETKGRFR